MKDNHILRVLAAESLKHLVMAANLLHLVHQMLLAHILLVSLALKL